MEISLLLLEIDMHSKFLYPFPNFVWFIFGFSDDG